MATATMTRWEEIDGASRDALAKLGLDVVIQEGDKGRCLQAKRRFRRGELVMRQRPIACAISMSASDQTHTTRCHHCHHLALDASTSSRSGGGGGGGGGGGLLFDKAARAAPLKKCSRCKFAHYCSVEHQKAAWAEHAPECKRMARCLEAGQQATATMVLLGRLFDKRARESKEEAAAGQRYGEVSRLAAHWGRHGQDKMEGYAQVAQLMGAFMGWGEGSQGVVEAREIMELLCRVSCNAYEMADADLRGYGAGLYPLAALINHSCSPNCCQTFCTGGAIEVRAMRDIEEGEEATISYVDVAQHMSIRKQELLTRFLFDCTCKSCTSPPAGEAHKIEAIGDAEIAAKLDKDADKKGWRNPGDHLAVCVRAVEACEAAYHPLNVTLMRARERAVNKAVSLSEYDTAARLCLEMMPAYRAHYPEGSPVIGMQCAMLGKIESYLGRYDESRGHLAEAADLIRASHGADSPACREVERVLEEVILVLQKAGGHE